MMVQRDDGKNRKNGKTSVAAVFRPSIGVGLGVVFGVLIAACGQKGPLKPALQLPAATSPSASGAPSSPTSSTPPASSAAPASSPVTR